LFLTFVTPLFFFKKEEVRTRKRDGLSLGWNARKSESTLVTWIANATPVSLGKVGGQAVVLVVDGLAGDDGWIVEGSTIVCVGGVGQTVTWLDAVQCLVLVLADSAVVQAHGHVSGLLSREAGIPGETPGWNALSGGAVSCSFLHGAILVGGAWDGLAVGSSFDGG
jgi:hypothetical protein